jgi:hypothetical protein
LDCKRVFVNKLCIQNRPKGKSQDNWRSINQEKPLVNSPYYIMHQELLQS